MHKREILKLMMLCDKDGYTLIPLSLYFSKSRVKMKLGVCTGKKLYDKRESNQKRMLEREADRAVKQNKKDYD